MEKKSNYNGAPLKIPDLSAHKWFLVMKISFFLLFLGIFQAVASTSFSQETRLTVDMKDVTIESVLDYIESQSDYYFMYNQKLVDVKRKVDVNVKDQQIGAILAALFRGTDVKSVLMGNQILLVPKDQQIEITRVKKKLQGIQVSGTVTDEKGYPLPGVTIVVKGTQTGTTTDASGNYSLTVQDPNAVLEFSYVGYMKRDVPVGTQTTIDVKLEEDVLGLQEVVVVGYGTQKKVNLTGAVDVVNSETLENRPAANVGQLLQGTAPNLTINLSNRGGEPGAGNWWNIRGVGTLSGGNSPLILVDGTPMDPNELDPETIESVTVLKDAAASAIYGSRAPFGVVLITTKQGKKGKPISVSYNNNFGWSHLINLPHFVDALTFVNVYNEVHDFTGTPHKFPDEQIDRIKRHMAGTYLPEYDTANPPYNLWRGRHDGNANYDWLYKYYRNFTPRQKHTVSLSGGSDNTQYYISAGTYFQNGSYNWADEYYKRNNIVANVHTEATKWLRFDFSTKYNQTRTQHPSTLEGGYDRTEFLYEVMKFWPTTPMYNWDGTISNPFVAYLMRNSPDVSTDNDLWVTLGTEIEPIKGWKIWASYNYNHWNNRLTKHVHEIPVDVPNGTVANIGSPFSEFSEEYNYDNYTLVNGKTSYEKQLGGHYFYVMVGYEQETKFYSGLMGARKNLISNAVPSISTALGENPEVDDWMGHWATQAVFGRINYNYKEKYLFEFNARYNGSSRFAPDHRWGFFPSVSAGYNISKEDFWAPLGNVVNSMKLRASFGSLGNQNVPNYMYLSTIPIESNYNWIFENALPLVAYAPDPVSGTLTWETVTTLDLGTDIGFFKNRLGLVFDWYNRTTSDMFGPAKSLPAVLGTWTPMENNAKMQTKGWEASLSWKDRVGKDFSYFVKFNVGNSNSKVLEYRNDEGTLDDWYAGKTVGEIWGYETAGFIQTEEDVDNMPDQSKFFNRWGPGDIMYRDLDGNDTINDGNRTLSNHGDIKVIGNSLPHYNIGISLGFNWKGIDFSMFWQGVGKRDLFVPYNDWSQNTFWGLLAADFHSTVFKEHMDYWRPANDTVFGPNLDAYYPKPYFSSETAKNRQPQTKYLLNAAYLRLKNLQVGYTLPTKISQKMYMQKLRIYFSAENLLTITPMTKLLDPETAFASRYSRFGVGKIYPLSMTLSFGLNVTF